jgi:hypothetical protein
MKASLVCILIFLAFPASPSQKAAARIEGTVRDLAGIPISEATVYAVNSDNIRSRIASSTDVQGQFVLRNVPPGRYEVRAYKESEGYPDTFFAFFYVGNDSSSQTVHVSVGRTVKGVALKLGPKYSLLKLSIQDERGYSMGASVSFMRGNDSKPIYMVGVAANADLLVPPVPFRFEIQSEGYEIWRSKLISPLSGQAIFVNARLRRSQRSNGKN